MKEAKLKEDLFGRLLGKESIVEPLLVDPAYSGNGEQTGSKAYPTIYQALQNVKKGGVIKLAAGVYRQNLQFKTGDIKIQANEPSSNVILINSSYPSIIVNLENEKEIVQFESIKFAHSGNVQELMVDNSREFNYMDDQINIFQTGENMNCIFYIVRGKVSIEECKFSLNVLREENKSIIPCIAVERDGQLLMTRCELFGSSNVNQHTIGVLSKKGSVVIKESTFLCHRKAALYLSGTKDTVATVSNCTIQKCLNGIVLIGDFRASVENSIIEDCEHLGIKVGMCNRSKIIYNTIRRNSTGIDYCNSDPIISNNLVSQNRRDGIVSKSKQLIRCGGEVKLNVIRQNEQAGVRCTGTMNQAYIVSNSSISFNGKCGILVEKGANPHIFKNIIEKNLGQGILLTEGSSAFIEKNEICSNIKANIALGGRCSINTTIIENKIRGGKCEGIFTIYGERLLITNNEISRNNQGIVAVTSVPRIEGNTISLNETNGVLLVRDCQAILERNVLEKNNAAGVFLRDNCSGTIRSNKFLSNKYELIIENSHPSLAEVHRENTYEGELRIPQNYECVIF